MNLVIFKYQLRLFFRNIPLLISLFVLVAAGSYSAFYGQHFVAQQRVVLNEVDSLAQNSYKRYEEYRSGLPDSLKKENLVYAGPETITYSPTALTGLAIGQKDNYPFYHQINSFENIYEVTTTTIQNPVKLLSGNFDLSFVIVYLLPLFIIVLGYNVLSEEKEQHTFTLLKVQSNVRRVVRGKLLFRLLLIMVLSVVLNSICFFISGIGLDQLMPMLSWILITLTYIIFWFSLVYLVISFELAGSINALILGGIWVLLLLVVPTVVNRQVSTSHDHEQVQMMFNRRGDMPRAYELSPEVLRDSFNRISHIYRLPDTTDTARMAKIQLHSFMFNLIQKHSDNALGRKALESTLGEYEKALRYNIVNPAFAVQNAYNQLAQSEVNNYVEYMKSVEKFENERSYWLFRYQTAGFDLDARKDPPPVYTSHSSNKGNAILETMRLVWPVIAISLLLLSCSFFLLPASTVVDFKNAAVDDRYSKGWR